MYKIRQAFSDIKVEMSLAVYLPNE